MLSYHSFTSVPVGRSRHRTAGVIDEYTDRHSKDQFLEQRTRSYSQAVEKGSGTDQPVFPPLPDAPTLDELLTVNSMTPTVR